MALPHIVATPAQIAALCALVDRVTGPYPIAGVDVGPGTHAPAAQSQTTRYVGWRVHPIDGTRAAMLVDQLIAAIDKHPQWARLTAAEQTQIKSAVSTAAPLTPDWDTAVP